MPHRNQFLSLLLFLAPAFAQADAIVLQWRGATQPGVAVAEVDLTAAARLAKVGPVAPAGLSAVDQAGRPVVVQFVPAPDFHPSDRAVGSLLVASSADLKELHLRFSEAKSAARPFDGTVETRFYRVTHDRKKMGGLPSQIEWRGASQKRFDTLRWHDRIYTKEAGSYDLRNDSEAQVTLVSDGPLATVVRVAARYMRSGKQPESRPAAVYDWCYWSDEPLVYVRGVSTQASAVAWKEAHFLELNFPGKPFPTFLGETPKADGGFTDSKRSINFSRWAALVDKPAVLGMFGGGPLIVYDNPSGYGSYLHAAANQAWGGWNTTSLDRSAWFYLGTADDPAAALHAATARAQVGRATASTESLRRQLATAQGANAAIARALEAAGKLDEAQKAHAGQLPLGWIPVTAGRLKALFSKHNDGVCLEGLVDLAVGETLAADRALPLFEIVLRKADGKQELRIDAERGWQKVDVIATGGGATEFRFQGAAANTPADEAIARRNLTVTLRATPDAAAGALRWSLRAGGQDATWGITRVVFPQVATAASHGLRLVVPQGAGVEKTLGTNEAVSFQGTYPTGWCSMPWMAVYRADRSGGLYVGLHDPKGGVSDLSAKPAGGRLALRFEVPPADMGRAGAGVNLPAEAVWQAFSGDWYDAAVIYRDWVRRKANWYPPLSAEGRDDTPRWMRELCGWALSGGSAKECVEPVLAFQKALDVPIGFHWYSWHVIPFDNDYPHYFPVKDGFAEGVKRLQASNVHVMPYINGRLWDIHDRGGEDWQFTNTALPATAKDEAGKPYLESYSSREKDGNKVQLAVMCPTTPLWQAKQREIVLRLMNEYGTHGVYLDQIAAARPALCFDAAHGHALGGGHWWTEQGYWPLLTELRKAMPADHIITTECNADPYIRYFDGYLTWHWQFDGQVPAFPAVYGGSIQMFGRAYRAGPTRELASRMKAGQQLVYGEQIGWIDPGVIKRPVELDFLRQVVRLRWQLRDYFYQGEMARPPRLEGSIPRVEADWQWSGVWPVRTDAVLAGTWRHRTKGSVVLLLVNVGDEPVRARMLVDLAELGLRGAAKVWRVTAEGRQPAQWPGNEPIDLPARAAWAWEIAQ